MDRLFAFVILIVLSPFLLLAGVVLLICQGLPIFFGQERVGKEGRIFRILKFRTMVPSKNGLQVTGGGDQRVTFAGRIFRRSKVDEMPQLWNIVRGEMAFVGPRPEVPDYVSLFPEDYQTIHTVRPGLTDYCSLLFRDEEEMLSGLKDPGKAYRELILPVKISIQKESLRNRRKGEALRILLLTFLVVARIRNPEKPDSLNELMIELDRMRAESCG